ncbi:DUF4058 family protein [Armatimonas sp.]|uniref:DUF4058 family protein n=1 Tax=Armatimonas sp. TaxID=1872638 RepID=UPI003752923A
MPSPFPGMDPYLESPEFFHDVHILLIAQLTEILNTHLPEGFSARMEERVYVGSDEPFDPDVAVLRLSSAPNVPTASGSVAVATRPTSLPRRIPLAVWEERLQHIEIVTARGRRRVVTAIEVLSPVNKRGKGREQYLEKQRALLQSPVHLIEIDLLRGGQHSVAVDATLLHEETDWDYLVCLHRAGAGVVECWDIRLPEMFPEIPIPLTTELPDFRIDLQAAFDTLYDKGPFRREVDYTAAPIPRLKGETATWAEQLLRAKKLR